MTCARTIRDLENNGMIQSHIPIIAVTANARPQQVEDVMTAGMVCIAPLLIAVMILSPV